MYSELAQNFRALCTWHSTWESPDESVWAGKIIVDYGSGTTPRYDVLDADWSGSAKGPCYCLQDADDGACSSGQSDWKNKSVTSVQWKQIAERNYSKPGWFTWVPNYPKDAVEDVEYGQNVKSWCGMMLGGMGWNDHFSADDTLNGDQQCWSVPGSTRAPTRAPTPHSSPYRYRWITG